MRRIALVLAAAAFLAGCAFCPRESLTIVLPDLPPAWSEAFPGMGCLLTWPGGGRAELDTWASGWQIVLDKAGNLPVLAYPVLPEVDGPGPVLLRPAGGIWPGPSADGAGAAPRASLELSWQDGAAAVVLSDLAALGRDTSLFNADRLTALLRTWPDPWDVDLAYVAEAIAGGDFSVYDIDPLPAHDVTVMAGTGTWAAESPFRPPAAAGPDGRVSLVRISEGIHYLVSRGGRVVQVQVEPHDTVVAQEWATPRLLSLCPPVPTSPAAAGCPRSP